MTKRVSNIRYELTWPDQPEYRNIGGLNVPQPVVPPPEMIVNGYKETKHQKFSITPLPENIATLSRLELKNLVDYWWHIRNNGLWYYIKGELLYFPGPFIIFLNFWTMWNGRRPQFRMEAWEFFQVWYNLIERDKNCMGLFNMKPRRLGDTEKALFIMWDRCTRFKNRRGGMQSYTDAEAEKAWNRLVKGHRGMPFFFRPTHAGSTASQLAFVKPTEVVTLKRLRDRAGEIDFNIDQDDFLGSYMDFEATATGKYDGDQLWHYFLDEIWKIPPHRLHAKEQWKNIRKVITLHNERMVYGKALLSSTVEETNPNSTRNNTDSSVEMATYFWENSDPDQVDEDGRTYTGLVRLFRDYTLASEVDEWGFHKVEQAKAHRDRRLEKARRKGDYGEVLNIYRKEPATPDEALATGTDECPFHPDLCYERLSQLRNRENRFGGIEESRIVEGNLIWSNGVGSSVVWQPQRGGRWHVSQVPVRENHVVIRGGASVPGHVTLYRSGCDPYDANQIVTKGSDGAFVVKRRFYPGDETRELEYNEQGEVTNSEVMVTNQIVCDYKYRHKDPNLFYEDYLKTLIWYGCQGLVEADKPGLINWFVSKGYHNFLQYEPAHVIGRNRKARSKNYGAKATNVVVNTYVERLSAYIYRYIWCCHHPRVVEQWAKFTVAKRTYFDLAVATGFCELAELEERYDHNSNASDRRTWSNTPWNSVPA